MKQRTFILILTLLMLPLCALPLLSPDDGYVCGRIRIGDTLAEIHTTHGPSCDCCPAMWNGGIVTTTADLSSVRLQDWADVVTLDGGHYVGECVEIIPCVLVGKWLIGWRGVVKTEGDILIYTVYKAYRFVRL